jgi:hypothetical protein
MIASTSRAESTRYSSPPYLSSVPPYFEKITLVAHSLYVNRDADSPSSSTAARTDSNNLSLLWLLLGGVWNN